jgi:hypothetical protein
MHPKENSHGSTSLLDPVDVSKNSCIYRKPERAARAAGVRETRRVFLCTKQAHPTRILVNAYLCARRSYESMQQRLKNLQNEGYLRCPYQAPDRIRKTDGLAAWLTTADSGSTAIAYCKVWKHTSYQHLLNRGLSGGATRSPSQIVYLPYKQRNTISDKGVRRAHEK